MSVGEDLTAVKLMLMTALTTMMMVSDTHDDKWWQAFLYLTAEGRRVTGNEGERGELICNTEPQPDSNQGALPLENNMKRRDYQPKGRSNRNNKKLLTQYQNPILLLDVFFQKVLEFGEAAQPVITLLCLVSFIPVVNIFVSGVVIRHVVHILCKM